MAKNLQEIHSITMKTKQTIEDFAKRWAVIFLHSEGWTISGIHGRQLDAAVDMARQKGLCPSFRYKVVRLKCSFEV